MKATEHICLLGLGEVGSALATGLFTQNGAKLTAWDYRFVDPASTASRHAANRPWLELATKAGAAASGSDLVISAVTAAQALPAAESILPSLKPGAWFLDLNSVSPGTKKRIAETVEASGARFVEAAVMSPIAPRCMASPILLGGPSAKRFLPIAQALGFTGMSLSSASIGKAAATKMCRSVVVKGMEAALTESLLAARYHGVEEEVIASLEEMFPHPDWTRQARYMISRSLEHGVRRAEEMREAAKTVAEAGVQPLMSEASAQRQDLSAQFSSALEESEFADMLDSILALNQAAGQEDHTERTTGRAGP